jgi:hypothetical protein
LCFGDAKSLDVVSFRLEIKNVGKKDFRVSIPYPFHWFSLDKIIDAAVIAPDPPEVPEVTDVGSIVGGLFDDTRLNELIEELEARDPDQRALGFSLPSAPGLADESYLGHLSRLRISNNRPFITRSSRRSLLSNGLFIGSSELFVGSSRELCVGLDPKYHFGTEGSGGTEGCSAACRGIERSGVFIDEGSEKVGEDGDWFFMGVDTSSARWCIYRIGSWRNNFRIASISKESCFINSSVATAGVWKNSNVVGFHPDEGIRVQYKILI